MKQSTFRPHISFQRIGYLLAVLLIADANVACAESTSPYAGTQTVTSTHSFESLVQRLERAITDNHMALVAQASASKGAAGRGVSIRGNAVLMVFRNDYAVRMLDANLAAGIEAPLRLYVTENTDGSASVTYRAPTATFAPYGSSKLDELARELDPVFSKIVGDAAGK